VSAGRRAKAQRKLVKVEPGGAVRIAPMPPRRPLSESRALPKPQPRPTLTSKRGRSVEGQRNCHACVTFGPVRQLEATVGPVFLCRDCEAKSMEESFGFKDAIDFARLGGGFEQNRKKH